MHITLTDRLTCPRCGPSAGLIVMMERAEDRRVVSGSLGCPVCRSRYPIVDRVADLRTGERRVAVGDGAPRVGAAEVEVEAGEPAVRVAALLGVQEGGGFLLIDGPAALATAVRLRGLAAEAELVVPIAAVEAASARFADLSALQVDAALPLADGVMRGAAYVGGVPERARLRELVRVTRPTGRVVVDLAAAGAPGTDTAPASAALDDIAAALEAIGAQVRVRDGSGLLAVVL